MFRPFCFEATFLILGKEELFACSFQKSNVPVGKNSGSIIEIEEMCQQEPSYLCFPIDKELYFCYPRVHFGKNYPGYLSPEVGGSLLPVFSERLNPNESNHSC